MGLTSDHQRGQAGRTWCRAAEWGGFVAVALASLLSVAFLLSFESGHSSSSRLLQAALRARTSMRQETIAAPAVSIDQVAFFINTGGDEAQWRRNVVDLFQLWGADVPHVCWAAGFQAGASSDRYHTVQVPGAGGHERFPYMLPACATKLSPGIRWVVVADEDTVFFPENLLTALQRYDPALPWYVGDVSEDLQAVQWYSEMAFGGGGMALSRPLFDALVVPSDRDIEHCVPRYFNRLPTGDSRLSLCIADLGVPLTKHAGFRQFDVGGDVRLLLQHWVARAPLISMHHMYGYNAILGGGSVVEGVARLTRAFHAFLSGCTAAERSRGLLPPVAAGRSHGAIGRTMPRLGVRTGIAAATLPRAECGGAFLGLTWAYSSELDVTVAVNAGFSVRVWPGRLPLHWFSKVVPVHGYRPWQPRLGTGFTFEAAEVDADWACKAVEFEATDDAAVVAGSRALMNASLPIIVIYERTTPRSCNNAAALLAVPGIFSGQSLRVAMFPCPELAFRSSGRRRAVEFHRQGSADVRHAVAEGAETLAAYDIGVTPCLVRAAHIE